MTTTHQIVYRTRVYRVEEVTPDDTPACVYTTDEKSWNVTTAAGVILGTYASEAAARTRADRMQTNLDKMIEGLDKGTGWQL